MSTKGSRRAVDVDVAPDRARDVASALRALIGHLPDHPSLIPIIDAGVNDRQPFFVLEHAPGEPLDGALHTYGPADIGDALPRLRRVADALDFAAAHGVYHGALTPRDILIATTETFVVGAGVTPVLWRAGINVPIRAPYAAPEIESGEWIGAASDQYAFAAIVYEWLFGRPVAPSTEGVRVRSLRDVDSEALAAAFNRAFAHDPRARFGSCTAFVDALEQSFTVPGFHASKVPQFDGSAVPPAPSPEVPSFDDLPIYSSERAGGDVSYAPPVAAFNEGTPPASRVSSRAVAFAVIAGAVALSALIGWLVARSRVEMPDTIAEGAQPFTEAALATPTPAVEAPTRAEPPAQSTAAVEAPIVPAPTETAATRPQRNTDVVRAAQLEAGLLVHSTPAGASVVIDGIARGVTPVAVRGLSLGTRSVVVTRPGYRASQQLVTLTPDRPSRSLEVGLVPAPAVASSQAVAREGALVVDSRPAGALVTIDGRPAGVTPLTIANIAAGTHTVRIEHPGYRAITTRVDVAGGQRARVAVRLEGGQDEE